jgi:hypothetical protein
MLPIAGQAVKWPDHAFWGWSAIRIQGKATQRFVQSTGVGVPLVPVTVAAVPVGCGKLIPPKPIVMFASEATTVGVPSTTTLLKVVVEICDESNPSRVKVCANPLVIAWKFSIVMLVKTG